MMNLACCYEAQERLQLAIKWFKYAIAIQNDIDNAHYGLALNYFKSGKTNDALIHVLKAIQLIQD